MASAAESPFQRRSFRAGDLDAELDLPAGSARRLVVLVPGLFATSAFFRVDADAGPCLQRWLLDAGAAVVLFDPRGLGRNRARARGNIDYAQRVADLGTVVDAAHALLPDLPLVLLGHSLGGTVLYGLLSDQRARPVRAAVTVGSPARLVPRQPPWEKLFTRDTEALVEPLAQGGWLDAVAFAWVQNRIYSGRGNWRWLPRWAIAVGQALVASATFVARDALRRPKVASFLFRGGAADVADYTVAEFQRVLRAGTIEREHKTLLQQLLTAGRTGTGLALRDRPSLPAAAVRSQVPVLAAWSATDELVLREEVEAWTGPATTFVDAGPCGHGGYFFKPGPRATLLDALARFLADHAP